MLELLDVRRDLFFHEAPHRVTDRQLFLGPFEHDVPPRAAAAPGPRE